MGGSADSDMYYALSTALKKSRLQFPERYSIAVHVLPPADGQGIYQWKNRLSQSKEDYSGERIMLIPYLSENQHWIGISIKFQANEQIEGAEFIDPVIGSDFHPDTLQKQFAEIFPNTLLYSKKMLQDEYSRNSAQLTVKNLLKISESIPRPIIINPKPHVNVEPNWGKNLDSGRYSMCKGTHKNILLVGRTRCGKSTLQKILIDPAEVPEAMKLMPGTREPQFSSFFVPDSQIMLNIIDSPGLFERGFKENEIRANEAIMCTIKECMKREITKLHIICFCMSFNAGIQKEDIESIELLVNYLGKKISKNSCLVLTRCESMDEERREEMRRELCKDAHFKRIRQYFGKGIFFSGAIDHDHFKKGHYTVVKDQFDTVNEYRNKLMDLLLNENEPFPISEIPVSLTDIDIPNPPENNWFKNFCMGVIFLVIAWLIAATGKK